MIWPVIFLVTVFLAVASTGRYRFGLLFIAAGLLLVAGLKMLPPEFFWPAQFFVWILCAAALGALLNLSGAAILIFASSLFTVVARFGGFEYEIGAWPLVVSDGLGLLAVALIGWPAITATVGRGLCVVGRARAWVLADPVSSKAASK